MSDRGNLVWMRREWRQNWAEHKKRIRHCSTCGRREDTGLIDGLCNRCFCRSLDAAREALGKERP
jgi:hypothetical protein